MPREAAQIPDPVPGGTATTTERAPQMRSVPTGVDCQKYRKEACKTLFMRTLDTIAIFCYRIQSKELPKYYTERPRHVRRHLRYAPTCAGTRRCTGTIIFMPCPVGILPKYCLLQKKDRIGKNARKNL